MAQIRLEWGTLVVINFSQNNTYQNAVPFSQNLVYYGRISKYKCALEIIFLARYLIDIDQRDLSATGWENTLLLT